MKIQIIREPWKRMALSGTHMLLKSMIWTGIWFNVCSEKSFLLNSIKNIFAFCFGILMVFVFLLFGGMQLISRITKPITEFSNALNQVTLHKKQKTTAYPIKRGCSTRNFHNGKWL